MRKPVFKTEGKGMEKSEKAKGNLKKLPRGFSRGILNIIICGISGLSDIRLHLYDASQIVPAMGLSYYLIPSLVFTNGARSSAAGDTNSTPAELSST